MLKICTAIWYQSLSYQSIVEQIYAAVCDYNNLNFRRSWKWGDIFKKQSVAKYNSQMENFRDELGRKFYDPYCDHPSLLEMQLWKLTLNFFGTHSDSLSNICSSGYQTKSCELGDSSLVLLCSNKMLVQS